MQTFQVTLTVTVNTIETVSVIELEKNLEELFEGFDSGNIEIENVKE